MRTALARLMAWLHRPNTLDLPGPIPLTAGNMLSQEWLAPHIVRLPQHPAGTRWANDV